MFYFRTNVRITVILRNSDHSSFFMNNEVQQLIADYQQYLAQFTCSADETDYCAFEKSKDLLLRISEVENSALAVFNMNRKNYALVKTKFDDQIGYPINEAYKKGPEYFLNLMPVEDLKFTLDTMKKGMEFLHNLDPAIRKEYKLIFEFRLSDPAGNLFRFIQQCVVLEQDKSGKIWLVLILNDLIPNRAIDDILFRKLIHIPTGEIYLFHDETEKSSKKILSQREMEILGLLSQGLQSKEISEKLFISVNTVNNHRQKIIEKMKVENTHEALTYARQIGII